MANIDIVLVYNEEHRAWLRKRGYPHPPVRPGNQMPTTADMKWALEAFDDLVFDYPTGERDLDVRVEGDKTAGFDVRGFDWEESHTIPGESFVVHGHTQTILAVLIQLCERCGQLYFYPDTGDPPIIVDARMDAAEVFALYIEACEQKDPWRYFLEQMYGP